jgi:tRNA-splicing ligase RtcB (3'-phosphate/5'-hydroxy nucleic acid ligase)
MKEKFQKINECEWILPKSTRQGMNVDAKLIANKAIFDLIEEEAIQQLTNVAMLPGVIEPVIAMPDAHFGF